MKKLFSAIFALIIIVLGIYLYDYYSGYAVTEFVNNALYGEVITVEEPNKTLPQTLNTELYSTLTEEEQGIYDRLYNGVSNHKSIIPLNARGMESTDRLFEIYDIMLAEHPEIFWAGRSPVYYSAGYIKAEYIYSAQEAIDKRQLIEKRADEILSAIDGSPYEKSLKIFNWVVNNTEYDFEHMETAGRYPTLSNLEGPLLYGKAICGGYAKAYQYLLQRSGIGALYVSGKTFSDNEWTGHAWVCQQLGDKYYYSDPTWCDCFDAETINGLVSHIYFCVPEAEMKATHKPLDRYSIINATDTKYNYFVKEGLYFDKYDAGKIRARIANNIDENAVGIELKFADKATTDYAVLHLFEYGEIHIILASIDLFGSRINTQSIGYTVNEEHNTIVIIFEKDRR